MLIVVGGVTVRPCSKSDGAEMPSCSSTTSRVHPPPAKLCLCPEQVTKDVAPGLTSPGSRQRTWVNIHPYRVSQVHNLVLSQQRRDHVTESLPSPNPKLIPTPLDLPSEPGRLRNTDARPIVKAVPAQSARAALPGQREAWDALLRHFPLWLQSGETPH
jgi:hypothetical protein